MLIRWLGIKPDGDNYKEEMAVRLKIASSAITYIEENLSYGVVTDEVLAQIKTKYGIWIARIMKQNGFKLKAVLMKNKLFTAINYSTP